jgi:hypothetical protein
MKKLLFAVALSLVASTASATCPLAPINPAGSKCDGKCARETEARTSAALHCNITAYAQCLLSEAKTFALVSNEPAATLVQAAIGSCNSYGDRLSQEFRERILQETEPLMISNIVTTRALAAHEHEQVHEQQTKGNPL